MHGLRIRNGIKLKDYRIEAHEIDAKVMDTTKSSTAWNRTRERKQRATTSFSSLPASVNFHVS